jgi:hypothetical protein
LENTASLKEYFDKPNQLKDESNNSALQKSWWKGLMGEH